MDFFQFHFFNFPFELDEDLSDSKQVDSNASSLNFRQYQRVFAGKFFFVVGFSLSLFVRTYEIFE